MGTWKGKANLSPDATWSHGPTLNLKYNSHNSKTKEISEEVVKRIGTAYDRAKDMLTLALSIATDARDGNYRPANHDSTKRYFTDYFSQETTGELDEIIKTLRQTADGIRASGEIKNRVYLYSKTSKPKVFDEGSITSGYVRKYQTDNKKKKNRPTVKEYKRGHIHINYQEQDIMNLAETFIHEATHRFAGTADIKYSQDAGFKFLTAGEAINNADSYAAFCRALYLAYGL